MALSQATERAATLTTDDKGAFVFAGLPPGVYSITVRATGFKTYELNDLKLNVGQAAELIFKMEVGEVAATVQVTSGEGLLQVSNEARVSDNFSAEWGRGNGAVINMRTKSGTNDWRGAVWNYYRNAALNARNFFAATRAPQVSNQFGGSLGGAIIKKKLFFFGSYEGTRNAVARAVSFQVETPELRQLVLNTRPNSIAARLFREFAAPAPLPGSSGQRYQNQLNLNLNGAVVPATATATANLADYIRFDQYLERADFSMTDKDKLPARRIAEYQPVNGGTNSSAAKDEAFSKVWQPVRRPPELLLLTIPVSRTRKICSTLSTTNRIAKL